MRKTFLYPIIDNVKKGRLDWLLEQSKKGLVTKYLNKVLPKKIIVGPTMAVFVLTYRCNSHCIMCDLPRRSPERSRRTKGGLPLKEFTTKEWKNVIDQLAEIKTAGIGFTGGEPLVRPDCIELMKYAKDKGISVTLNTNAGLLTKEKIDQILDINIDNINISLDGIGKAYDTIRGISYKNVIANTRNLIKVRDLRKSSTKVTMVMCVSHYNINEMDKIVGEAIAIGADKIGFIPMHYIPNTKVFPDNKKLGIRNSLEINNCLPLTKLRGKLKISPLTCQDPNPNIGKLFLEKLDKIRRIGKIEIDNSTAYLNMFPLAFSGDEFPIPCLAGETSITIDCYGNLFACWPFLELNHPSLKLNISPNIPKIPNIPNSSNLTNLSNKTNGLLTLKSLWFSKDYEEIRKLTRSCRACFWNCHSELSIFYK